MMRAIDPAPLLLATLIWSGCASAIAPEAPSAVQRLLRLHRSSDVFTMAPPLPDGVARSA